MTAIEIPADVRDNSETVTDYAFMRHHSPDKGRVTSGERDDQLRMAGKYPSLGYTAYQWDDVNPDGQRCRFDMIVQRDTGVVSYLFHTEYFTRIPCILHEAHYATHYASVTDHETGKTTTPGGYCDECMGWIRRFALEHGETLYESEPLIIGQHD